MLSNLKDVQVLQLNDTRQLIVAPIMLIMNNYPSDTKQASDPSQYVMYLGLVRNYSKASFHAPEFLKMYITYITFGIIIASIILTTFCIFQIAHNVIRPLR